MNFMETFKKMKAGEKAKLPSWAGYWYWDPEKETIVMHTKGGMEIDIRNTQRTEYTLMNILSDEWVIADEQNCPEMGGEAAFSFGEAVKYLKRGLRVTRKGWNGKGMYIRLILPGNACCDHYPMQPCIGMKTADGKMQPGWLASQADILAEDWMFAE